MSKTNAIHNAIHATDNEVSDILGFTQGYGSQQTFHPALNVSALTDIWAASFVKNKEGVWFMNGGVYPVMGLCGGNNTLKTGKLIEDLSTVLFRFIKSVIFYYDSESTLDIGRLAEKVDRLYGVEDYFFDNIMDKRFFYMPAADGIDGTKVHNRVKEIYENLSSLKNSKDKKIRQQYEDRCFDTVVWSEKTESYLRLFGPMILACDSITEVGFDKLAFKQFEEGDMDEGGKKRTRDLEIGNLRRVLMEDTCRLGPRVGLVSYWVAQTATRFSMDGKPLAKETTHMKQDKKISAPKMMQKQPHIGIEIEKTIVHKNKNDGNLEYPSSKLGTIMDAKLNPDLLKCVINVYRNKSGHSGPRPEWLCSQSYGFLTELSMYDILKGADYYGLVGSKDRHHCVLYPEQTITRKTAFDLFDGPSRLSRAVEIVYHLWYLQSYSAKFPRAWRITPEELYTLVKEQGHDWNEILDTIYYTHDNPAFIKQPTLCIYELLEVAINKKPLYWKEKK